jgi:hypothetical protein
MLHQTWPPDLQRVLRLSCCLVLSRQHLLVYRSLDLSNNQLTGSIPGSVGDMSRLFKLYLATNRLAGSIPSSLPNLKQLQWYGVCGALAALRQSAIQQLTLYDLDRSIMLLHNDDVGWI